MKKRKDKLISVYLMFGLILLVIGFSYAFFIYNKTGLYTHTITGGKMKVIYDEVTGNNITIENAYPLTDEEALTKGLEFEFTVTGYNESEKNIYYAIEMDHGEDVSNKNRFLDSDMKLTLYENEKLIFENEIYDNLDNQDIYYGYINAGTSSENPTINNYKMNIWINDNVIISDTLPDDFTELNDGNLEFILSKFNISNELDLYELMEKYCPGLFEGTSTECPFSNFGLNIYSSDEFANSYANFKVNIRADLTYKDVDHLTYDANGGTFNVEKSSLLTNRVTIAKPVKEGKAFVGWSSKPDDTIPEYYAGDHYNGDGKMLYAIYSDEINKMTNFPKTIMGDDNIAEESSYEYYPSDIDVIIFMRDELDNINERYQISEVKADVTYENAGDVRCWVEFDENTYETILYVASPGVIYLTDCVKMFKNFTNCQYIDLTNVDTSLVTDMTEMFATGNYYAGPSSNENINGIITPLFNNKIYENIDYNYNDNYLYINLEVLNTSNVLYMDSMFEETGIYSLDLSNFDFKNTISTANMFSSCGFNDLILNEEGYDTSNIKYLNGMFSMTELDYFLDFISNMNLESALDMSGMFSYAILENKKMDLSKWDTSKVEDMSYMFSNFRLHGYNDLDLNFFDTSNVTDMSLMFSNTYLNSLNIENWNTSKVENMSHMFMGCMVQGLNLNNWNVSNVKNMSSMFSEFNIDEDNNLDLSSLDTSNVTDMSNMFSYTHLNSLNIENWNTSKVENMSHMFSNFNIDEDNNLDLSSLDTSNVTDMSSMFEYAYLNSLNIENWNTSKVENMSSMFSNFDGKDYLDLSKWDTSEVTNMEWMFSRCVVPRLNLNNWNVSNVENMSYMFYISDLENLNTLGWSIFGNVNFESMFSNCSNLRDLDLSSWNVLNVENMSYMFNACINLENLDLSSWNVLNVENMSYMFNACKNLENLDLSNFGITKVVNMSYMFSNCNSLLEVDLSNLVTNSLTNMSGMFYNCFGIETIKLTSLNTTKVTSFSYLFYCCKSLTTIEGLGNFNASNVTSMSYMFADCESILVIDLSGFYTPKLTNISFMFAGCEKVVSINMCNFDTSNVTNMSRMFAQYKSSVNGVVKEDFGVSGDLEVLDISNFTFTSKLTNYQYIFSGITVYAKLYVKSETERNWILGLNSAGVGDRPGWGSNTTMIVIKNS